LTRFLELAVEFETSVTEGEIDKHLGLAATSQDTQSQLKEIHRHINIRHRI